MKASTLVSLAILKANADILKKDYIENFVPIVAQCIKNHSEDVISTPEIQKSLKESFGLDLPQNVIIAILKRVSRAKYVRRERGVYYKNHDKIEELNFENIQIQLIEQYDKVIELMCSFCKERYDRILSTSDAESALSAYIEENQIAIVSAKASNSVVPHVEYPSNESKYLVAAFISYLQETKSPFFRFVENVVYGNMIANAVFLPDSNQSPVKFRDTAVYFDTTFILFAIGHAGEARQAPALELLKLLQNVDAKLYCFEHTLEEIRGVLYGCRQKIENGDLRDVHGATMLYFISQRSTSSDILLYISNLERDMKTLGIEVIKNPDYAEHEYVIDELELERVLNQPDEKYGITSYHNEAYRNPRALKRDVDSISAIMRLRRGKQSFYYEDCTAIFVTTNQRLNRISRELFYRDIQSDIIPSCQTDQAMTNIVWLKQPNASPDLPRKRIIADCYAAIQPSDRLIRAYYSEIEKLKLAGKISDEQYFTLRYDINVFRAIADQTLGIEEAFTEGTVDEILEFIRNNILREQKAEQEKVLQAKQEDLEAAYQKSAELMERLNESLRNETARKDRIAQRSDRIGSLFSNAIYWILFVSVCVATFFTFPWGLPDVSDSLPRYISTGFLFLLVILFLLSISNMMFGTRVLDIRDWIKNNITIVIKNLLLRIGG
ncbi:hypothetical protein [Candidatus Oscillochloris fontis]|uniref:hypothetical protein n=1 Tax=Candidatus Oscillochloris fontis TaxID=2496868 RepID=UPI00101C1CA2|nr:hypothetical protein [Candidatus Oscillochloris fontis]